MENFDTHFNGFYKRLANKSTPTLAASTSADVTRRTKAHGQMPTAIVAVLFAAVVAVARFALQHRQRFIIQINIKHNSDRAASSELGRSSTDNKHNSNNDRHTATTATGSSSHRQQQQPAACVGLFANDNYN